MVPGVVLLLLAVCSVSGTPAADRKLVYVTVLFRHGDRSPIKAYPTDPYQESDWPQGFGQLSQVGMRQHLELGQFLRKRYNGFLNESYDRHEILVRSTDYDRTLMSAEANLAGLYPPTGDQIFTPNIKWQPIPVHTVPQNEEDLLSFPLGECPRYKQLMNETEHSEEFLNITAEYQDFIDMVRTKTGLNKTNVESIWSVYDTLFCESRHNKTPPHWVTPTIMEKLKVLKDFSFQVKEVRVFILLDKQIGLCLPQHDTTVAALQASMNIFNGRQPPYASCQIIELYRDDKGTLSVSMFYRNDSSAEPYQQQLPGCAFDCPLEDFVKITKPWISDDREKECQLPSGGTNKEVIISLAVSGSLLFLLIVLLLGVICWQKEPVSSRGYQHVINEGGEGS
uniref:Lysosomal acid phosphatase n=1 Tax=Sphaeramia orbicularis TaxID=375764 RepID=A0A673BM16_9TELE